MKLNEGVLLLLTSGSCRDLRLLVFQWVGELRLRRRCGGGWLVVA